MEKPKKTLAELSGRGSVAATTGTAYPAVERINWQNDKVSLDLLRAFFEITAEPLVVVDQDCKVEAMNIAASQSLSFSGRIRISSEGKLQMVEDALQSALREKVTRATAGLVEFPPALLNDFPSGKEPVARITPLRVQEGGDERLLAMVCINFSKSALYNHRLASSIYGLSRAELAICDQLVTGKSVKEIAASRGTSTETVRYQLKSIFSKTHTNSQHGLVSLLLRATPLPMFREA
ncbi:MAG: helix-turn-helix transcriptional regulator [Granulosicoccaceae bacterium]